MCWIKNFDAFTKFLMQKLLGSTPALPRQCPGRGVEKSNTKLTKKIVTVSEVFRHQILSVYVTDNANFEDFPLPSKPIIGKYDFFFLFFLLLLKCIIINYDPGHPGGHAAVFQGRCRGRRVKGSVASKVITPFGSINTTLS